MAKKKGKKSKKKKKDKNTRLNQFHEALKKNNMVAMKRLLKAKADPNKPIYRKNVPGGITPLHLCLQCGKFQVAKFLLENGADINYKTEKQTASILVKLVFEGHTQGIKFLCENHVYAEVYDNIQCAALGIAACNNKVGILKILIAYRANVNDMASLSIEGATTILCTPLSMACQFGAFECVKILLENHANVNQALPDGNTALLKTPTTPKFLSIMELLLTNKANINAQNKDGISYLQRACFDKQVPTIQCLLNNNADANFINSRGWDALMIANQKMDYDDQEITEILLHHGADLNKSLLLASKSRDFGMVQFLLKCSANINSTDVDGNSILMISIQNSNSLLEAKILLQQKADINIKHNGGQTALHCSIFKNSNFEISKMLIEAEANVNESCNNGCTPLMRASGNDNFALVKYLVQNKANLNQVDNDNVSAIMYAVNLGRSKIAKFLLEKNANVNLIDKNGYNLFVFSFGEKSESCYEITKWLIENGTDINQRTAKGGTGLILAAKNGMKSHVNLLLKNGANPNIQDALGFSAMMYAVDLETHHAFCIVENLLKNNADLNLRNNDGITAFLFSLKSSDHRISMLLLENGACANEDFALYYATAEQNYDVVKMLITFGANVNLTMKANPNECVINIACKCGNLDIVKLLVENNAKVNVQNDLGYCPLLISSEIGHLEIVKYLVRQNADIYAVDTNGENALLKSLEWEHFHVADFLYDTGNWSQSDLQKMLMKSFKEDRLESFEGMKKLYQKYYYDALIDAIENENVNKVKSLVENKANENVQNCFGDTGLMIAAIKGNFQICNILLKNGANVNEKSKIGEGTALMFAAEEGKDSCVKLLLQHNSNVNETEKSGYCSLMLATSFGHLNTVQLLLENCKIDYEQIQKSYTIAEEEGYNEIQKVLQSRLVEIPNKESDPILTEKFNFILKNESERCTPDIFNQTELIENREIEIVSKKSNDCGGKDDSLFKRHDDVDKNFNDDMQSCTMEIGNEKIESEFNSTIENETECKKFEDSERSECLNLENAKVLNPEIKNFEKNEVKDFEFPNLQHPGNANIENAEIESGKNEKIANLENRIQNFATSLQNDILEVNSIENISQLIDAVNDTNCENNLNGCEATEMQNEVSIDSLSPEIVEKHQDAENKLLKNEILELQEKITSLNLKIEKKSKKIENQKISLQKYKKETKQLKKKNEELNKTSKKLKSTESEITNLKNKTKN